MTDSLRVRTRKQLSTADFSHWCRVQKERSEMLNRVNKYARKEGNPMLSLDDIPPIPQFCSVLGIELRKSPYGHAHDNSPSVDAIRHELGHVKGNLRIVSQRANRLKGNATLDELILIGQDAQQIKNSTT